MPLFLVRTTQVPDFRSFPASWKGYKFAVGSGKSRFPDAIAEAQSAMSFAQLPGQYGFRRLLDICWPTFDLFGHSVRDPPNAERNRTHLG